MPDVVLGCSADREVWRGLSCRHLLKQFSSLWLVGWQERTGQESLRG